MSTCIRTAGRRPDRRKSAKEPWRETALNNYSGQLQSYPATQTMGKHVRLRRDFSETKRLRNSRYAVRPFRRHGLPNSETWYVETWYGYTATDYMIVSDGRISGNFGTGCRNRLERERRQTWTRNCKKWQKARDNVEPTEEKVKNKGETRNATVTWYLNWLYYGLCQNETEWCR